MKSNFSFLAIIFFNAINCLAQNNDSILLSVPINATRIDTTFYKESGRIETLKYYVGQYPVKSFVIYDDSVRMVKAITPYLGPWIHGNSMTLYENGVVESKLVYWKGIIINGVWFYPSGKKMVDITGDTTGYVHWNYYYENGTPKKDVYTFKEGLIHVIEYCEDGKKKEENYYDKQFNYLSYYCSGRKNEQGIKDKHGTFIGLYIHWYENGRLAEKGHYVVKKETLNSTETVKDGKWIYYDENGKLLKTEKYKKGKLVK